jgi:hypothetical protein
VTFIPAHVFSGETTIRDPMDVFATVKDTSPFILRDGRLYTFADLRDEKTTLCTVVDVGTIEQDSLNDWLLDENRSRQLIHLLRRCLSSHLKRMGIGEDKKKRFFFRSDRGKTRSLATPGDRGREVAAEKTNQKTGETFWVHHGARLRFKRLVNRFFLSIDPTFIFTTDGTNLIEGKAAGKLTAAWGGRQQNDAALRNVIFWSKAMAMTESTDAVTREEIIINTGAKAMKVTVLPAVARLSVGIEFESVKIQSLINQLDRDELDTAAEDVVLEPEDADEDEADEEA